MTDQRVDDLEMRLAFQDDLLRELNDALYRQQDQIERLQMLYRELREEVTVLADDRDAARPQEQRPPHY